MALHRVWRIPRDSYRRLISLTANCLPLLFTICQRFLRFIQSCLVSDSYSVNAVTRHSFISARMYSVMGHNVNCCADMFGFSIADICKGLVSSNIVISHYCRCLSPSDPDCARCARELIWVRDDFRFLRIGTCQTLICS